MPHASNLLLASLPSSDLDALRPHLRTIELPQGMVIVEVGDAIEHVHFPHSGVVSLVVPLESGDTIESAMIGRESLVGASAGLNGEVSVYKAVVQIAGAGSVVDTERFRGMVEASAGFPTLFSTNNYPGAGAASAACNATHTVGRASHDGCCVAAICRAATICN